MGPVLAVVRVERSCDLLDGNVLINRLANTDGHQSALIYALWRGAKKRLMNNNCRKDCEASMRPGIWPQGKHTHTHRHRGKRCFGPHAERESKSINSMAKVIFTVVAPGATRHTVLFARRVCVVVIRVAADASKCSRQRIYFICVSPQ